MRDLAVINYHRLKAYCSAFTWTALVIIWLYMLLEFTAMIQFSLFSLQFHRHSFFLNLPCRSSQFPCMAEMLCLTQSFCCWCLPSIPAFEMQLIMSFQLYSIAFCITFSQINTYVLIIISRNVLSKPWNGAFNFFKF